jgi:thioredoxin-like negative regulator of GroEL
MGIGRVYFTQSLVKEALAKFSEVLSSDPQNDSAKLWMARCYISMNDKITAKKLCYEVLAKNAQDSEALELSKGL